MDQRGTRGFRAGLRDALPAWRAEGIVDEAAAARLAERHGLADPALDGLGLLPVFVLAALLVGAGVVSLVAWNWDALGRAVKVALVVAMVVAAHLAGAALRRGPHPRLGEAVTLLGSLLFGAGIALMAQIFNVSGPWYGIFGGFALGALAAGLLLDSGTTLSAASVGGLAIWSSGWSADHPGGFALLVPYALALPLLALGWRRRSPALLAVTVFGLAVSALASAGTHLWAFPPMLVGAAALAVPLAAPPAAAALAGPVAAAGRLTFALAAFVVSFGEGASGMLQQPYLSHWWPSRGPEATTVAASLAGAALLLGLVRRRGGPLALGEALSAAGGLLLAGLGARLGDPVAVAVAANAALVALAGLRITAGVASGRRRPFWEGVVVAGALLLARFLEIEHHLWLKGLGFIAAGALVAFGAAALERRRREVRHAA